MVLIGTVPGKDRLDNQKFVFPSYQLLSLPLSLSPSLIPSLFLSHSLTFHAYPFTCIS